MIESLQTVLLAIRAYQENRSEENLKNFIVAIDAVCEEVDTSGDSVWTKASESLFSRCDRPMKERSNAGPQKVGAFAQFWREAFALHRAIKQLLYLTASVGMRGLLKGPFVVGVIPLQKGPFKYDLGDDSFRAVFSRVPSRVERRLTKPDSSAIESDSSGGSSMGKSSEGSNHSNGSSSNSDGSQLTYDKFIAHYSAKRSLRICKEVHVHCELALLAHFLTEEIEACGFTGVSKPCCLGCWFYLLAYNEVAERSGRRLFRVLGTNSKAYYGWIKPILDVALDQEIEEVLAMNMEIISHQ